MRGGRRALLTCGVPPRSAARGSGQRWASGHPLGASRSVSKTGKREDRRPSAGGIPPCGQDRLGAAAGRWGGPGLTTALPASGRCSLGVRVSQAGCGQGGAGARSARLSSKGVQGDVPTVPQPRIHRAPRERGAGDADHTPAALTAQLRAPVSAILTATRPPKHRHTFLHSDDPSPA